jgi:tetratricopeptide (TPR) repeat protein
MSAINRHSRLHHFFGKAYRLVATLLLAQAVVFAQDNRGAGVRIKIREENGQEREVKLYDGSYALIIGNGDYTNGWPKLPGVTEDIGEVGRTLEKKGFSTEFARDLSRDEFRYRLETFINTHGLNPENQLLIYFAGHGYTEKVGTQEVGYIVMTDAPTPEKNIALFRQRAIEMSEVEFLAKRIKAKHALFVFDSCFSGSLMRNRGQKPSSFISSLTTKPVREFITSGSADQVVPDKSVFRVLFQRALSGEADYNNDNYVTGSELGLYLQQKVADYTNNAQTPQFSKIRDVTLDEGDFVFSLNANQPNVDSTSTANECSKVQPIYTRGRAYLDEGKYDLALEEYNKAIAMNVKCAEPYLGRGLVYISKKDLQQASKDFDKAVETEPYSPRLYHLRGMTTLFAFKDSAKAIEDFSKATQLCVKTGDCTYSDFISLGKLNALVGEFDMAIEGFTYAIKLKPTEAEAYQRRGSIYLSKKNEMNLAYADFDKAVSLDPSNAINYHYRGVTFTIRGVLEKNIAYLIQGVVDFGKAIELDPNNIESYEFRAHCLELLGETEKAEADKRKAEEMKQKQQ